jgi:hypothetical protein
MGKDKIAILLVNILVISAFVVSHFLHTWPLVGHDYAYFIPRLLDTHHYLLKNGLQIQWYTPSFGGGLPAYPNPQHIQFSLVQLLLFVVEPFTAIVISTVIFIGLGFIAFYLLLSRVFLLNPLSSILGSVFFSANGFVIERIAVGHLGYQTFPLIAVIVWLVLDKTISTRKAAIGFGIIVALIIHQAGFYLLIGASFSILMTIVLAYLYKPFLISTQRAFLICCMGTLLALFLSASKLSAIYSFMQFFPREMSVQYETPFYLGLMGIFLQLLGTMNLVPLLWLSGLDVTNLPASMTGVSGAIYGYWEFDMSLSPIVFIILLVGIDNVFHQFRRDPARFFIHYRWVAWIIFLAIFWITIEFILGRGFVYPFLMGLPVLNSLHVRVRFSMAFIIPIVLVVSIFYNSFVSRLTKQRQMLVFACVNILAILPLLIYFIPQITDFQVRKYDASLSRNIYQEVKLKNLPSVSSVLPDGDTLAMSYGASSFKPYEPIFGYSLENFHPELKVGSVWEQDDGFYNFTNPTGYVFPLENNTRPFERFRTGDDVNLQAFLNHEQPDWQMPTYQLVFNRVSILALFLCVGIFIWDAVCFAKGANSR